MKINSKVVIPLVERVACWNSARYDRVYDHKLQQELIFEELHELYTADNWVDVLDGVGDVTFIAIGAMWKMGIKKSDIVSLFIAMELNKTLVEYNILIDNYVGYIVNEYKDLNESKILMLKTLCHTMFITCFTFLNRNGMLPQFYVILSIICDSNETKDEPKNKVKSSVKANTSKGTGYVPPTDELKKLIERVKNERK